MPSSRNPLSVITGVALIVAPLVAWGLKLVSGGWMVFVIIFGPILVLLAAYALQIVIAAQGFLSKRELFGAARLRATLAAWLTSLCVLALGIFMPDGGDTDYGSTLQVWMGAYGPNSDAVHAATDDLTAIAALLSAVLWVGAFVWLFVEWVVALGRRRRSALAV
ncbi:hypothetical protein [Leucobacter sp. wl10]|uniref:hypothetical protein n=1 Tax=Leucobacter sp. wl10 TaxID=2304677 RepID=UPI000E5BC958|nr:hypothetical protein [Leucobacter sp. wl10]RGE20088.1 hypothetical protein D1J51_10195 [Leucobacter sp. wl10]